MSNIIQQFEGLKVLVVGDVMIDAYYFGKVERISPEAPVPIVAVEKKENRLGGAANVALNLAALGAKPIICSVIGKDKDGEDLIHIFEQQRIGIAGIVQSAERITTVKTRVIAQGHQMLRVDSEQTNEISAAASHELVGRIAELINHADVLIFEDYDKGVLTKENIEKIIAIAKEHQVPIVVDPKKRNFFHYQGVDLFKPNIKELKDGMKLEFADSDDKALQNAAMQLMASSGIKNVMVTRSERGVMIANEQAVYQIPAHLRKVADVSGAGDTVISIAALCIAVGLPIEKAAALANLGGGLVCEELGVVPISKEKLTSEAIRLHLAY
jgi:rfaE bifunctional protein kinase chain/domain